jgi:hypothetical protein
MRRTAPTIAALALLAGCGNDRTPVPDVVTPGPPIGAAQVRYPEAGISFLAPGGWRLTPGTAPLVVTAQTGQATLAVWRYPRTEPLPRTSAQLRAARDALVAEAKRRDPTFKLEHGSVTEVGGAPAVQLRATETINGLPRKVRSTHVYARGAEIVFDAYTAAEHFDRVDQQVFRPVLRTVKLSEPRAAK